jgi:hypothetical protein
MERLVLKEDDDFTQFVRAVQDKAAERGFTEEILSNILNDADNKNDEKNS